MFDYGLAEISTTSGTGSYVLSRTLSTGLKVSSSSINDGDQVAYQATDGNQIEFGRGTYSELDNSISRDTIVSSSNDNNIISWPVTGQRIVSIVIDKRSLIPSGGVVGEVLRKTANGDYYTYWDSAAELPPGGLCRQALFKQSNEDYDAAWEDVPLPLSSFVEGWVGGGDSTSGLDYIYVAPSTGDTLTAVEGQGAYVINPSGSLATLNIVMPPIPGDKQIFEISTSQDIDGISVTTSDSSNILGGSGAAAANGGMSWRFVESITTWFRRY